MSKTKTDRDFRDGEYVICPRCKQEVYKEAIICPFASLVLWHGLMKKLMKMENQ